ncbi:trace amine-associated receptor 3-like [Gouania willdenowi]|uniref:trace amine-associated receptor 3-like n=1 Tax=Gouania willdenowi TaxID=441366 RepID=UPI0010555F0D|nr:trace amine-associated receptor 3-like [Gouania willdenowi]
MITPDEAELCYPHLGNSSCRRIVRPHSVYVLLYIILSSISVLTVTLNLLVIITISHFKKLHSPTNFLLLSLAVSDFCVGFIFIFQILIMDGCWYLSAGWCVFYIVFGLVTTSASVGTVVLICIDRYIAVCDPLHYATKVTVNRARMSVVLCWFSSALYTLAHLDNMKHPGGFNSCIGECVTYTHPVAKVLHLLLTFILPVSTIIILYVRVFVVAVSQARAMHSHVAVVKRQGSVKVNKSELKAARVLGVVVVVFLCCLIPLDIVVLSARFAVVNGSSVVFFLCLYYFNSCVNPMIYVFLYPWFRKCVKYILSLQILKSGSSEANIM